MSRRRAILAALALVIAVMILAGAVWNRPASVRLADGSRLVLRAVDAGTNCLRDEGSLANRLARWLPESIWPGNARPLQHVFRETNLVFWLEHQPADGGTSAEPWPGRFAIGDEAGTFVALPAPSVSAPKASRRAVVVTAAGWARRDRHVALRVFDQRLTNGSQLVGEFRVSNPVFGVYPEWASEATPASRPLGQTAVTVGRCEIRPVPVMGWLLSGTNVLQPRAFIRLHLTNAEGAEVPPWLPARARLVDPTGNRSEWVVLDQKAPEVVDRHPAGPNPGSWSWVASVPVPWPGEPVLRLESDWRARVTPTSMPYLGAARQAEFAAATGSREWQTLSFTLRPAHRTNGLPGR